MRGGPYEPTIDSLPDELELKEQARPTADWETALLRASSWFGLTLGQTLNAANVGKLVDEVRQKAADKREAVARLVSQVRDRSARYAPGITGARQQSAESAQALLAWHWRAAEGDVVTTLANASAADVRGSGQPQPGASAGLRRCLGHSETGNCSMWFATWWTTAAMRRC
jgi:hypothetical protein